jgi:hypothetical protein
VLFEKADDKSAAIAELEALAESAGRGKRREIEEEMRILRAGHTVPVSLASRPASGRVGRVEMWRGGISVKETGFETTAGLTSRRSS